MSLQHVRRNSPWPSWPSSKQAASMCPWSVDHPADRLVNMAQQAGLRRLIVLDDLEPPKTLVETLKDNGATDASDALVLPRMAPAQQQSREDFPDAAGAMTDLAAILFTRIDGNNQRG